MGKLRPKEKGPVIQYTMGTETETQASLLILSHGSQALDTFEDLQGRGCRPRQKGWQPGKAPTFHQGPAPPNSFTRGQVGKQPSWEPIQSPAEGRGGQSGNVERGSLEVWVISFRPD